MPHNDQLKLSRPPLVFVLTQVRFPKLPSMERYVADFHEWMRQNGFPRFDEQDIREVTVADETSVVTRKRWTFSSRDREATVVLTDEFLIYETSSYDDFEGFLKRVCCVFEEFVEQTKIDFATRVGLRFVNVIRSVDDKEVDSFISAGLRGAQIALPDYNRALSHFITKFVTPSGNLVLRSLDGKGANFMPPDLRDSKTKIATDISPNELWRTLDIDHYTEDECDFQIDMIRERLATLHESVELLFLASASEDGLAVWAKGEKK